MVVMTSPITSFSGGMYRFSRIGIANRCVKLAFRRFNSTLDSLTSTSALLANIFPTCRSCGIRLQTMDKTKPGYYLNDADREINKKPYVKHEDVVFNDKYSQLPVEDRILLMNKNFLFTKTLGENATRKHIAAYYRNTTDVLRNHILEENTKNKIVEPESLECIRCRDASYRSDFKKLDTKEFPVMSLDSIVSQIPRNEKIVYVVSAQDFPISLDPKIFQHRLSSELFFIINKSDLLFKSNEHNIKYGLTFFQDYLNVKHGIPRENVIMVSGKTNWNIDKVLNFINTDGTCYLMGCTNSGKSTVMTSLLFTIELERKQKLEKLLANKEQRYVEKLQEKTIRANVVLTSRKKKEIKKFEEHFKAHSGPGISYIPGFTRSFMKIDLPDNKVMYDVPGFVNSKDLPYFYNLLKDPKSMKNISKGSNIQERGMFYSKYISVSGGQCLSMGGLFYLNVPTSSMVQVRNCINNDMHVFKSFNKALDVSLNYDSMPSFKDKFVIEYDKNTIKDLQRFIIPPFYGSIDLVISNLGHINLVATGAKATNEPFILYLPKGLEAKIRQPISQYLAKTFSGRDKNGNPLTKENISKKSTFAFKRYSGKTPFSSKLITCANDKELLLTLEDLSSDKASKGANPDQVLLDYKRIREFAGSQTSKPINYDASTVLNEENKYDYWVE
ncbi:genetic interactor of prohibitins 3, mitochondrial [Scheffersomyces coipomensis]|uniref:genetic interactor of prohibitins 3, mitochondrial n=1 Tax=Scheffersomyces coipomensis TaxID=1788519 RepID=UPI00315DE3DB